MQHQKEMAKERMTRKKCSVKDCTSVGKRMFAFPSYRRDPCRFMQWVKACGRQELIQLPPQKLLKRTICSIHFEEKYMLRVQLSRAAVPTRHLPVVPLTSPTELPHNDNATMEVAEQEEHQLDQTMEPADAGDFTAIMRSSEYPVLSEASRYTNYSMQEGPSIQENNSLQSTDLAVQSSECRTSVRKGCKVKFCRNSAAVSSRSR